PVHSTGDRLDLPENRGRGVPGFNGNEHNAAAARLDRIPSDDLIRGPVGALDEDVGLDAADDLGGRILVEDRDRVDAGERADDFRAFLLWDDRPIGALVAPHRLVWIEADRPHGASGAGRRDIAGGA